VLLIVGQHAVDQRLGVRGAERRHVQRDHFAVDANLLRCKNDAVFQ